MRLNESEEQLLRSVALQNARAVLLARERAEREATEARERVTNILESITDAFFALDREWRFTYVNRRGEEMLRPLQTTGEQLIGRVIWEEFPDALGTEFEANYRLAVEKQETITFETCFGAQHQWFEVRAYPGPEGLSVYFHEVTQRRQAAQELRMSAQRLRAVFNQAAVGITIATIDGKVEEVNRRFTEILGYTAEEVCGKKGLDLTHPSDREITSRKMKALVAGEIEDYILEKRYLRKDGKEVWSLTSVTLLRNEAGEPDKLIGVIEDITQRKEAEQAMRESAERAHLALSAGRLGDWSWDAGTNVLTLGPGACEAFGVSPGTALKWEEWVQILHPEDRDAVEQAVKQALTDRTDYEMEYRVRRAEKEAWLAARGKGVYGIDGSVTGMIGVVHDITHGKEAEEIRSRLAAVVESSDDAIISMTLDTIITTWNQGAERMFGYHREEVIGKSVSILIPPDSDDEEPKILEKLLQGERVDHYETVRARKDGTLLNVSLTVSPVHDASGKIIGVSKISRDITEHKKNQADLEEERRLLEVLNNTGQKIASQLDLEQVVQTVTDSATELTGAQFGAFFYNVTNKSGESFLLYTLSGAPREAFEDFGHPRATELFGPTFRGEPPVRCDDVLKDPRYGKMAPHFGMPKGHLPVRSYLAVPVVSRTGEVIGGLFFGHSQPGVFTEKAERLVVGVAAQAAIAIDNARLFDGAQREIAQRKRVEEALRDAQGELQEHAEHLEDEVAERTVQLRETIQELEAFSYSVSHDMRSPLRAMQGYSDALIEDYHEKLDATAQDYLKRIRRSAARMDLLIQDVLAYSRVAQGDVTLRKVKPERVIRDVIQNYPGLQPDHASITIETPIPPVQGHDAYLTQVVSNLLNNAVKFVAAGTRPEIKIQARIEGEMVRIVFEDNGIGIAPEHQEQIFQIFGRVYPEKMFEGTGIGLAIVKKAAERMGGRVEVASELGRGSRFSVILRKD